VEAIEVRVAAVMALGLWLSYTSKMITPEAKQLYLAGAQLPHIFKKEEETSAFFFVSLFFCFFVSLFFNASTFATGFEDVKDTTRHAYLESFIVALKSAREDWTLST